MTDQLTLRRSSRTYAGPYDLEGAKAVHSRLKKFVPVLPDVEHTTEDWAQVYVTPSDTWALIEDGDSTYSTSQSKAVLAANTSQAKSCMYTDELYNVVIVYKVEDNTPELERQRYRNFTSEFAEPYLRLELGVRDHRGPFIRLGSDATTSATTVVETQLARRLRKMKFQYPLMGKQFDDAIEFAEYYPDTKLAPSVWTDNEAEVVLEWILPEKHHAIVSFEGDGQFGYALRFGDQFLPGKAAGLKPFRPPTDLVRYISEK